MKGVRVYKKTGEMIGEYFSIKDASEATGVPMTSISKAIKGQLKFPHNLYFEMADVKFKPI